MSVSREVDKRGNRTKRESKGYKPSLQRRGYVTGYTLAQSDFPVYRKALASSNGLSIWLLQATSSPYYRERSIWSICPVTNGVFVTGGNVCSVTNRGIRHRRKSLLCREKGYSTQKEKFSLWKIRVFVKDGNISYIFALFFSHFFTHFCLMKTNTHIHYFIRITIY